MLFTITPAEMKALETRFMAENDVPGALLMEHAAQGVADAIARRTDRGTAVFLCGPGNNGGDGYAAARLWSARGGTSHVIELSQSAQGDALLNRRLALLDPRITFEEADFNTVLPPCDVIVDALFGTGLSRAVGGAAAHLIHGALDAKLCSTPVIAVDIPSGLCGTTGHALGSMVIRADETVTFHDIKQGLLLADGPDYAGEITVQPILIPRELSDDEMLILESSDLEKWIAPRAPVCHKGDFGRIAIFCGSRGMAGAAALCANAAMRTGAGLTTILCRESLLPILQTLAPAAMCAVLPERDGQLLPEAAEVARRVLARSDAACIGCGLGQSSDAMPLLRLFARAECPVVWDADALNLLAKTDDLLPLKECDVITPHPGEAARLLDCTCDEVTSDARSALERLHELCGCTVLLKGARSLVTDGMDTYCNMYTTPALAKGGSGDVLTGIITALLGRQLPQCSQGRMPSVHAAAYGALIHGLAGRRAAKRRGVDSVLPTDVIDCIRLDAKEPG